MTRSFKLPENYSGLFFEGNKLEERFEQIVNFYGLKVFDSEHAISQFKNRFPNLSMNDYKKTLLLGLKRISDDWDFKMNSYAIISKSLRIKIPIEIRPDRFNSNMIVGITPSTLNADDHIFNTRNEIEILVENSKNNNFFQQVREFENVLTENDYAYHWFNHYFDCGKYWKDFEEIEVE